MAFSRQEYWNGLPFPSLGYLPDPGIEPRSPAFQIIFCLSYLGSLPSVPKVIQKKILNENFKNYTGLVKCLEKAMAPHSSTLAWKIPWTEEPGRLQSMLRVGHDWATSLSLFTFMYWRRKWQPTPVFLPGKSQGQGSLVGCRLWGRTEWDTTEVT